MNIDRLFNMIEKMDEKIDKIDEKIEKLENDTQRCKKIAIGFGMYHFFIYRLEDDVTLCTVWYGDNGITKEEAYDNIQKIFKIYEEVVE